LNWYKNILTSDYKSDNIPLMEKELIIMRGIPGAGKSYKANELAGNKENVFSADDYHINPESGKYEWKPEDVKAAHQWNHDRVKSAIRQGISPVIIDNTHVKKWELLALKPIIQQAKQNGYNIKIEEPNPDWYHWDTAFNPEALYERNKKTHNVPLKSIQRMVNSYDHNVTIDDIINHEKEKT